MNTISGRVTAKSNGRGVKDLLVVLYDLDPGTVPEDATPAAGSTRTARTSRTSRSAAATANPAGLGDRLGSRLTDDNGYFRFEFEDEAFRLRNAKEQRPDLHLVVLGPEEPGADLQTRTLYTSAEIRQDAGRTEEYLIRLPDELLTKAGVVLPVDPAVAREGVTGVVAKLEQAQAWRKDVAKETKRLASERVAAAREGVRKLDTLVEKRVVEALTGMTAEQARARNIVPPGDAVAPMVWRAAGKRIEKANAQPAPTGWLVLTPEEAERFRANGAWRTDIPADEIEPYLFRANDRAARPVTLTREDPVAAMCKAASAGDPLATVDPPPPAPPPTVGGEDAAVDSSDLPRFVGRLVNGMVAPEAIGTGANGRPDADALQQTIAGLRIASGPADVTAFHDYHNLQIAFDYVWQQMLDEDVVATVRTLAHTVADAGGDPIEALAAPEPIKALRNESRVIARANDPFDKQLPDWVGDLVIDPGIDPPIPPGGGGGGGGGSGGGGGGRPDWPGGHVTGVHDVVELTRYPHALLAQLDAMLNEKYKFEVFAPGSTNFGLLVSYRQRWEPGDYQCGDVVNTLTLAPKEVRKVSAKRTVKRERSTKETESNLRNRSDESRMTMRADAEVVDRASTKTNFNLNAKGSYNIGLASGDSTTTVDRTAEAASQETKKSFHESVMSAAMQLRSEKSWSFESKDSWETETSDVSELTNPNDELTVTYLFYELERRYRVTEHLHRLTPVVLVAMEVPNPGRQAIDRVLLAHSWIINRVLLDDRYRAPLEYLCNRIVGDELALQQLAANLVEVRKAVEQLNRLHRDMQAEMNSRERAMQAAMKARADKVAGENTEGGFEKAWEWATGSGDEEDIESARIIEDMHREAYERSVREEKDLRMRLDAETAALTGATQEYAKAYAEHTNRLMEVGGLRVHFKENVLYYMQAIWSFTFEDQIFFSLCNIRAPKITANARSYAVAETDSPPLSIPVRPGRVVLAVTPQVTMTPPVSVEDDAVSLAQIADLDSPLGFKGNYMIFPLRESNPLTDMMMVPYVDTELGLHDPDDTAAWDPEAFARYARCLLKLHRERDDLTDAQYKALEDALREQYTRIVSATRPMTDEIIVPTNSLFIEALPGAHPLLEDFKLLHRLMDVGKVREEVRRMQLESLRYAARILDNSLEDPEIDKQIVINGATGVVVPGDP